MKININEILYDKRKIRDLSNFKKKKINKSNSQINNYYYTIPAMKQSSSSNESQNLSFIFSISKSEVSKSLFSI